MQQNGRNFRVHFHLLLLYQNLTQTQKNWHLQGLVNFSYKIGVILSSVKEQPYTDQTWVLPEPKPWIQIFQTPLLQPLRIFKIRSYLFFISPMGNINVMRSWTRLLLSSHSLSSLLSKDSLRSLMATLLWSVGAMKVIISLYHFKKNNVQYWVSFVFGPIHQPKECIG